MSPFPTPIANAEASGSTVRRLMIYFGLVYFAQGIGQAGALISQPLMYYLKSLEMTTDQVAALLAVLTVPWIIKPVYGLISDYILLFGYRRKSYLFLMNGLAAAGFLWLTGLTAPSMIVLALFLTALGIASSDVLVDALAVVLYFVTGILSMIPLLTLLSLAAAVCPPQAAGFTFAGLMSIYNGAGQLSQISGAYLYERLFHQQIRPLIVVAAIFTLGALLIVPFLPDTDRSETEPEDRNAGNRPL